MEDGDAILEHMEKGDPDLDPVWGLLVDAADGWSFNSSIQESPTILEAVKDGTIHHEADDTGPLDICDNSDSEIPNQEVKTGPISNVVDKAEVLPEMFPLTETDDVTVTFHEINGCDAFVLDGVLTTAECQQLIRPSRWSMDLLGKWSSTTTNFLSQCSHYWGDSSRACWPNLA